MSRENESAGNALLSQTSSSITRLWPRCLHFLQSLPSGCPRIHNHHTGMLEGAPLPAFHRWTCCPQICLAPFWSRWYHLPQKPSLARDSWSSSMLFWWLWVKIQESHLQTHTPVCRMPPMVWVPGLLLQCMLWCLMPSEVPSDYGRKGHRSPLSSCATSASPTQGSAVPHGTMCPSCEQLSWALLSGPQRSSSLVGWIALWAPRTRYLCIIRKSQLPVYIAWTSRCRYLSLVLKSNQETYFN